MRNEDLEKSFDGTVMCFLQQDVIHDSSAEQTALFFQMIRHLMVF